MQRLLFVLLATSFATVGCEQEDPNSVEHWIKRLASEERTLAIQKLGEMKDPKAVEPLMEAYKQGHLRYNVVAALAQIGDKKAIPVLLEALQDPQEPKAALLAGNTLIEWEAGDHGDVYVKVAADPGASNEAKLSALQLLAKYPVPQAEPSLLAILAADPDLQPIVLAQNAAEALGKLGSKKAVPDLVFCMWKNDALGRHSVSECRLALARIGGPNVLGTVLETLSRKNRKVEKYARKYKFDKGGLIEAKCAELLGDVQDPAAVDALVEALKKVEEMPPSVQQDPKKAQQFAMASTQKTISIANALALIGDERAVEPLLAVAGDKERILQERIAAIQQLAFLGSQKAIPDLMQMLADTPHPNDPNAQGLQVEMALAVANGIDGTDEKGIDQLDKQLDKILKDYDKWVEATKKKIAEVEAAEKPSWEGWLPIYAERIKRWGEIKKKVETLKECKADLACWDGKIADKNEAVSLLAAYRLAQGDKATALPLLQKHVGHEDLTLRNVILFGIERSGDASVIPALEAAKKADLERAKGKGKQAKMYKGSAYNFDLLIARMQHRK